VETPLRIAVLLGAALAGLGAAPAAPSGTAPPAPALGFLHVEGNVGGASGGHAALAVGDAVYHFLLHPDGVLHLTRDPLAFFRYRYAVLQNRPLHRLDVALEPAALARAADGLAAQLLRQQRALDEARALTDDAALLDAWIGTRAGAPVDGAGLLDPTRTVDPHAAALRARVEAALGAGALAREIARLEAALVRAQVPADARAVRGRLAEREALNGLLEQRGLAPAALLPARPGGLSPAERDAVSAERARLTERVVALLRGARPDRGRVLLVAIARHHALARSLDEGRLRLLDPLPDVPPTLSPRAARLRRAELAALAARYALVEASLRSRVAGEGLGDGALGRLEEIAGRGEEYRRGAEEGRAVREPDGRLLPLRRRDVPVPASLAAPEALRAARARVVAAEADAEDALRASYGYALLTQNCVTELARALEDALGGPTDAAAALGVALEPERGARFVPSVFFASLRARRPDASETRVPSFRERALAAARAQDGALRVALRESNVLTSRIYRWRDRDTTFLFFTTGPAWLRPPLGVANLAIALAELPVGVASASLDRGRRLRRAAYGALYSLPELAGRNVRKGSFDAATLPRLGLLEAVDAVGLPATREHRELERAGG
jgi:hypothetical protein